MAHKAAPYQKCGMTSLHPTLQGEDASCGRKYVQLRIFAPIIFDSQMTTTSNSKHHAHVTQRIYHKIIRLENLLEPENQCGHYTRTLEPYISRPRRELTTVVTHALQLIRKDLGLPNTEDDTQYHYLKSELSSCIETTYSKPKYGVSSQNLKIEYHLKDWIITGVGKDISHPILICPEKVREYLGEFYLHTCSEI